MSFLKQGLTLKALLENPELLEHPKNVISDEKGKESLKDNGPVRPFTGQSAYLGQQLWDKTVPLDVTNDLTDFKLEYMDLDEFLSENCIPSNEELNQFVDVLEKSNSSGSSNNMAPPLNMSKDLSRKEQEQQQNSPPISQMFLPESSAVPKARNPPTEILSSNLSNSSSQNSEPVQINGGQSPKVEVDFDVNPGDLELARGGDREFDPRKRAFSDEELRPQPIIKKSRKIFVPDDCKDERYWKRRRKNNDAAKKSREARRIKENQITLRAAYLETENKALKSELKKTKEQKEEVILSHKQEMEDILMKKNEEIRLLRCRLSLYEN